MFLPWVPEPNENFWSKEFHTPDEATLELGVYSSVAVRRIRPILDAECGCCEEISAVYGFSIATRLQKIQTNGLQFFAYFVASIR